VAEARGRESDIENPKIMQLMIEQGIDPKEGKAIEPFAGFLSEEEKIKLKKDYERSRESGE